MCNGWSNSLRNSLRAEPMSSEETFTTEEIADLENWDRKRLQRQCKKVGIKANLKTVELLDSLRAHYQSNLTMDSADPRLLILLRKYVF